jgi:RNA polymerase sigma-70 factor, ECF subfamily
VTRHLAERATGAGSSVCPGRGGYSPAVVGTAELGESIFARARSGDAEALGVIWRTYQPWVLRYLRARGFTDPQDLATQVWLSVVRSLGSFDGGGDDFPKWLFAIVHRRAVDERRRWARQSNLHAGVLGHRDSAEDEYDRRDSLDRAVGLIAQLPETMANAILLRVLADLSVAETARIMGLRPAHVRVLVHRGLRRLEKLLRSTDSDAVTLRRVQSMNS